MSFESDLTKAELESKAQIEILAALRSLGNRQRAQRVMRVARHLCEADEIMPGVLSQFLRGREVKEKI
jgi:hypothetical protein